MAPSKCRITTIGRLPSHQHYAELDLFRFLSLRRLTRAITIFQQPFPNLSGRVGVERAIIQFQYADIELTGDRVTGTSGIGMLLTWRCIRATYTTITTGGVSVDYHDL